jgi:hypothetical protein
MSDFLLSAHKLALSDLGKAIAINPSHADNYYLRGDCQCKLGHYEQVKIMRVCQYWSVLTLKCLGAVRLQSGREQTV